MQLFLSVLPSSGAISLPLQLGFERPVEKLAAGGPDQTLRQPEERSQ